jgi:alanyl-tRNA synthetase
MPDKTQPLFEADPYLRECDAVVREILALPEGQGVVLDKTVFYPEGGGQPADRGTLNGRPVFDVTEQGDAIVHVLEGGFLKTGDPVRGILDWDRRFDHMQQHSGQHLLSQAFVRILEADTASFHLGSDDATIDIVAGDPSWESMIMVENEANRIVFENREIRIVRRSAHDLDAVPLRKRPALTGDVRLVEIHDYDWSLCCGTHVRRTGEIGLIKILRWEKYKGGSRVHFVCGGRALGDYRQKSALARSASQILTAGENEIVDLLEKWRDERKASEKRIQALLDQVLEAEADGLIHASKSAGSARLVSALFRDRNPQEVQALVRKLVRSPNVIAIVGTIQDRATVFFARSADLALDVRVLQQAASEAMNGKGGGNAAWAQCSSDRSDLADQAVAKAIEALTA